MSFKTIVFTLVLIASIIFAISLKSTNDEENNKDKNNKYLDSYIIIDKICTEKAQKEYEKMYKKYGSDKANLRYNIVYRKCINNSQNQI